MRGSGGPHPGKHARVVAHRSSVLQTALPGRELLSNIEQFEKELLAKTPGTPSVRAWVRRGKERQQSAVFSLASNKFFKMVQY